jgi:2-polyprenyl-3-methyl-5-hydroxy-6-metoxy-1,4-benzoquinol methylase
MVVAHYYSHCRHDILAEVPRSCQSILSVGCGAGATEAHLVRAGARVVGIEQNAAAAAVAKERGLDVIQGDVVASANALQDERFDCLIYADILEHLADPVAVLQDHVPLLESGGTVIISVPNFRNYLVFRELFLHGHIRYTDSGILDRTHLRITTRRMVEEWLDDTGLTQTSCAYRIAMRREKLLNVASLGLLREFLARQVIIVAKKGELAAGAASRPARTEMNVFTRAEDSRGASRSAVRTT